MLMILIAIPFNQVSRQWLWAVQWQAESQAVVLPAHSCVRLAPPGNCIQRTCWRHISGNFLPVSQVISWMGKRHFWY